MKKKFNITNFINNEVKKIVTESVENGGESYSDMIDRLDDMSEMVDETENMCTECGGELKEGLCESCNGVKESKRKVLRLNETQLKNMVQKIISEKEFKIPSITTDTLKQNEKINNDNIKDVDEKVKFLNKLKETDEVDDNKYENTEDDEEYIEDFRGGGMEDLDYDNEPDKRFLERMKLSLVGDHIMGNGSEEKDKTGEKIHKKIDRKKKKIEKEPMYEKEPTPVKIVKESVDEDISKMMKLIKHKF